MKSKVYYDANHNFTGDIDTINLATGIYKLGSSSSYTHIKFTTYIPNWCNFLVMNNNNWHTQIFFPSSSAPYNFATREWFQEAGWYNLKIVELK